MIERRDHEREREELGHAYDAATDDEAERKDDREPEHQATDGGDELDVLSYGHMSDDDTSALPESGSGGDGCESSTAVINRAMCYPLATIRH